MKRICLCRVSYPDKVTASRHTLFGKQREVAQEECSTSVSASNGSSRSKRLGGCIPAKPKTSEKQEAVIDFMASLEGNPSATMYSSLLWKNVRPEYRGFLTHAVHAAQLT